MIEPLLQRVQHAIMPIGCGGGKLAQTWGAETPHKRLAYHIVFGPHDRWAISIGASATEKTLLQTLQPFGPARIWSGSRWEGQIVKLVIGKQWRRMAGITFEPEKVLKTTLSRVGEGHGISCDILVKGRPYTDDLPFISSKTF